MKNIRPRYVDYKIHPFQEIQDRFPILEPNISTKTMVAGACKPLSIRMGWRFEGLPPKKKLKKKNTPKGKQKTKQWLFKKRWLNAHARGTREAVMRRCFRGTRSTLALDPLRVAGQGGDWHKRGANDNGNENENAITTVACIKMFVNKAKPARNRENVTRLSYSIHDSLGNS